MYTALPSCGCAELYTLIWYILEFAFLLSILCMVAMKMKFTIISALALYPNALHIHCTPMLVDWRSSTNMPATAQRTTHQSIIRLRDLCTLCLQNFCSR